MGSLFGAQELLIGARKCAEPSQSVHRLYARDLGRAELQGCDFAQVRAGLTL